MQITDISLLLHKHFLLIKNAGFLSIIKFFEYVFPLITVPYLTRVLGPAGFGEVALSYALMAYFLLFVDFGFEIVATKEIAENSHDLIKISEIFSTVTLLKFCFILVSLATLVGAYVILDFSVHLVLAFSIVIGKGLYPIWFFLGVEKTNFLLFFSVVQKVLFLIGILLFVNTSQDFAWVVFIDGLSFLIISLLAITVAVRSFGLKTTLPSIKSLIDQLKTNWKIFFSKLSVGVYTSSTVVILSLFYPSMVVGYFSAAEKLIKSIKGMIQPLGQALFPYMNRLKKNSATKVSIFLQKLLVLHSIIGIGIGFVILFSAPLMVELLFGSGYEQSVKHLYIMSILPLLVLINNILGTQSLLVLGYESYVAKSLMLVATFHLVLSLFLAYFSPYGVVLALVITEMMVCAFFFAKLKSLNIFK